METMVHELEVIELYENILVLEGSIATSQFHEVEKVFDKVRLREILMIQSWALLSMLRRRIRGYVLTSKFKNRRVIDNPRKVLKGEMPLFFKLLFEVVHKEVLPRGDCFHEVIFRDIGIAYAINLQESTGLL